MEGSPTEPPEVTAPKRVSFYPEWMDQASCGGMEDTLFFGASDPDKRPQYTLTDIKAARKICASCPVTRLCLETSLINKDEFGVFAGSTRTNRAKILKRIESGSTTLQDEVTEFVTWIKEGFR